MMINSTSAMQYQAIQQQYFRPGSKDTTSTLASAGKAGTDSATISSEAQQLQQIEHDIVSKYDVTNMSPADMREMAGGLNAEGLITDEERLNMTFELSFDNLMGLAYDENKPTNQLQQFQNRYEVSKQTGGNAAHSKMLENMLGLLERYQGMQQSK